MDFGGALALIRQGRAVCRPGWNGAGMYVRLHEAPGVKPFLAIKAADGETYAWVASQADALAEDWERATRD